MQITCACVAMTNVKRQNGLQERQNSKLLCNLGKSKSSLRLNLGPSSRNHTYSPTTNLQNDYLITLSPGTSLLGSLHSCGDTLSRQGRSRSKLAPRRRAVLWHLFSRLRKTQTGLVLLQGTPPQIISLMVRPTIETLHLTIV